MCKINTKYYKYFTLFAAGVRLPYNHRQKAYDNGTLEVYHVERATDQGPYVCVATNRDGQTAQSTVVVRVQGNF